MHDENIIDTLAGYMGAYATCTLRPPEFWDVRYWRPMSPFA